MSRFADRIQFDSAFFSTIDGVAPIGDDGSEN
jgi:hypothetical protein